MLSLDSSLDLGEGIRGVERRDYSSGGQDVKGVELAVEFDGSTEVVDDLLLRGVLGARRIRIGEKRRGVSQRCLMERTKGRRSY